MTSTVSGSSLKLNADNNDFDELKKDCSLQLEWDSDGILEKAQLKDENGNALIVVEASDYSPIVRCSIYSI